METIWYKSLRDTIKLNSHWMNKFTEIVWFHKLKSPAITSEPNDIPKFISKSLRAGIFDPLIR